MDYRRVIYSDAFHGISCCAIASMLYTWSHEEARGVIQFLWAKPATITCCDDCIRLFAKKKTWTSVTVWSFGMRVTPHAAHIRHKLLQSFRWELLHHPPCSSGPAPSGHHYRCGLLK